MRTMAKSPDLSFVVYVDMQFDIRVAFSVQIVLFIPPILTSAEGTWHSTLGEPEQIATSDLSFVVYAVMQFDI